MYIHMMMMMMMMMMCMGNQVELTYMGIKSNLEYYFPDGQEEPHHPMCVSLPQGIEPLNEVEEQQVARYAYDQVNKSNNKNKYVRLYVYIYLLFQSMHLI
jgi:hypothetical protein